VQGRATQGPAVYGGTGDHLQPVVPVSGQVRARPSSHANAGEGPQRYGFEAQVLLPGTALGGRHVTPIALQDFGQRSSLGRSAVHQDAVVDLGLEAAGPLLGERLVVERTGLRRRRRGGS